MQTKRGPVRTNKVKPLDPAFLTAPVWNLLFNRIHAPIYHHCSLLFRMGPLFVSIAFQLSWFLVTLASVMSLLSVIWCQGHCDLPPSVVTCCNQTVYFREVGEKWIYTTGAKYFGMNISDIEFELFLLWKLVGEKSLGLGSENWTFSCSSDWS